MVGDSELDEVLDEVYDWICDFIESDDFGRLGPEHQDAAEDVLLTFTEFMYTHHGLLPEEWDEPRVEACCLETIPGKVISEEAYFRSVAPVLSLFFRFAGGEGYLDKGAALSRRVQRIGPRILDNAVDPRFWGPAKTFAMAALRSGVDPTDERQMNTFMALYNQALAEHYSRSQPVQRSQPKVGRNDPCPCGSGKKYGKCCGA